jgi:RNA polymerase sigma-70 factor (ECF subfamily)
VRSFAHRRISATAADDVVSEVFVTAWRRLDEVPSDELPWLLGIARGVMANQRRGESRRHALHQRLVATSVAEVEPSPDLEAGESAVLHALSSLGENDQEVLRLVAWDGLDRARAAQVLGISAALFAVRLHRARRRLARSLAAQFRGEQATGDPPAVEVSP